MNYNERFLGSKLYIIDFDMLYTIDKIYSEIILNWKLMQGLQNNKSQNIFVVGINKPENDYYSGVYLHYS